MDARIRQIIAEHARAMIARAHDFRGLDAAIVRARGEFLGPEWAASIADAFGPDEAATVADVARKAMLLRTHPEVVDVGDAIRTRLFLESRDLVDGLQRSLYTADSQGRARIYDRLTNPEWTIEARVEERELRQLAEIPLDGHRRDDWLMSIANEWRSSFVALIVRSLAGAAGGYRNGARALAIALPGTFETWRRKAERVGVLAGLAAINASMREFRRAFSGDPQPVRVAL